MMSDKHTALQQLIKFSFGLAFIVVFLGAWTRLNDAGLGCPDWPACYGNWIIPESSAEQAVLQNRYPDQPLDTYKGWLEMTHRYVAGLLGSLILVISVLHFRSDSRSKKQLGHLPFILLALVTVQALFGMWTVTLKLLPEIVTLHLLGGLLTLSLLFELVHRSHSLNTIKAEHSIKIAPKKTPLNYSSNPLRILARLGLLLIFVQILLGGWTSSNYAGWACNGWLSCNDQMNIPLDYAAGFQMGYEPGRNYEGGVKPLEARAAIQMSHRGVGILLAAYIISFGLLLRKHQPQLQKTIMLLWLLTLIQMGLGFANAVMAVPLSLATAHHAFAVAILITFLRLNQQLESHQPRVKLEGSYAQG